MAVDCHFHVVGPQDRYPQLAGRGYTPPPATLAEWSAATAPLGVTRGVAVQPSIYGTDNTALLAALAASGGRVVWVGAADAGATDAELDALVAAGVRGLRFAHFQPGDARMLPGFVPLGHLPVLAPRMRERRLHADLFTDSRLLAGLSPMLQATGVAVVIDHMGRTPASVGLPHAGIAPLRALVDTGRCWVKLSGLANVSRLGPRYEDARAMHDWLTTHCPDRLVWGSDWPHTKPSGDAPSTQVLFERFLDWTPSIDLRRRILVETPDTLYFGDPGG